MTLQQLRYLLALDDHRHFGRAAEASFVAQPTLTTQIKKLEDHLGVQLFNRRANPIQPTPTGEKVIAQARIILDEVGGLKALLAEESSSLAGTYTLGIIPTLAPYLLPLFLQSFAEAHPEVRLVIREMQSEDIIEGLKRKQIDLGLLVTPLEDKQLREIPLFYEPFLIFAAPGAGILQQSPLLPEHVLPEELLLLEQGHCFRNQVLNICHSSLASSSHPSHLRPRPLGKESDETSRQRQNSGQRPFIFQAGSIETLKNMVKQRLGYTIIPEMSVHPELDEHHIKRFAEPQPAREVSLVVSRSFPREKLIGKLRGEIQRVVPEEFKKSGRYVGIAWR